MAGSILRRSAVYPRRMSDFRGTIHQCECPEVADSRRLGDEIHQRPPNGDVRPIPVNHDLMVERLLRKQKRSFRPSENTGGLRFQSAWH